MFFREFPKTLYSFDFKNDSPTVIANIFSRFKIRSSVLNNTVAFYKYQLQEGDTPEIVAYQQYGDASYHWVICMVPWICAENYEDSMKMLQETDAKYCMGHFEISGFAMYRGMPSEGGLDRGIFRKFSHTFSGHYHHRSTSDDIHYVGNPYELTWQDYNDARGFHIFDLDSDRLDFVKNPNVIFHKIKYDDKEESITDITNKDLSVYTGTYVKVVVINKTNPYLFDKFMNSLYNVNPVDITIAEDFTELTEGIDEKMVDQAEDTLTILNKYVDSIKEDSIDNTVLKNLLKELYVEALNTEQA